MPNTNFGVTMRKTCEQTTACGTMESVVAEVSARDGDGKVGSKTCSGLTYLELCLIDIVGLKQR
jgi:hypothetical protein